MTEYIEVGKIVNTHGIKGEVRVMSQTDFPDQRFAEGSLLWVDLDSDYIEVEVSRHRLHKQFDLLTFKGYNNVNDVLGWVNHKLLIEEGDLNDLDESNFYIHDIIGLDVESTEGEAIGKVKEVHQTASNDVWMVERPSNKDLALPILKEIIQDVDLKSGIIKVDIPGGLDADEN